ncbi:MAG: acyltransferase domain-containing protein [Oscillospiraceae bacterium]|nr:acyltransferase domain-containing protein [Oscillospiraceae bacterium]
MMYSGYKLALFSGASETELEENIDQLRLSCGDPERFEKERNEYNSSDRFRSFAVYENAEDLMRLTAPENRDALNISNDKKYADDTVFLFPGSGIHQKKMLTILSGVSPFFMNRLQQLDEICSEIYDVRLLDEDNEDELADQLRVLASEIAIAEHWERLGCCADHVIGHSMGEYAAAVFSGIISEKSAFFLLKERCLAMCHNDDHCMAAAESSAQKIMSLSSAAGLNTSISAYNAPEIVTVCGTNPDMQILAGVCKNQGIRFSLINGSRGGHYEGLRSCAEEFLQKSRQIKFSKPRKNFISTLDPDGIRYTPDTPEYWYAHIFRPVMFSQAVSKLPVKDIGRVIDAGVSPVLINMVMKTLGNINASWIPTVRSSRNYGRHMLHSAGCAFNSGINISIDKLNCNII